MRDGIEGRHRRPAHFRAFCLAVRAVMNRMPGAGERLTALVMGVTIDPASYYDALFARAAHRWLCATMYPGGTGRRVPREGDSSWATAMDCVRNAFIDPSVRGMGRECILDVCAEALEG